VQIEWSFECDATFSVVFGEGTVINPTDEKRLGFVRPERQIIDQL